MSINLVIKKFPLPQRNRYEQIGYRSLCSYEKHNYLRQRLFKTLNPKKALFHSFKKFWFCNNCFTVFSLKPAKKYKTLQRFPLQCPKCKSEKILHNSNLVNAIINKKTLDELLQFSDENNIEVDYEIKRIKYHLELSSNSTQKKIPDLNVALC